VPLSRNLGTLTSWNPLGHSRPVTELLYPSNYFFYDAAAQRGPGLPHSCDTKALVIFSEKAAVRLLAWSDPEGSRKLRFPDNVKGKAVPLQAWGGPEGSRKLRFPDFLTTAQDDGKVVSLRHRPHLPTGNTPGTHFC
jgi:hypothetical protein